MKLWEKGIQTDKLVEDFTAGNDRELDLLLAPFDILGSVAHAVMLHKTGFLTGEELAALKKELTGLYADAVNNRFEISPEMEDVHSQVEHHLTSVLGEAGKKIHTARSRNDQVLVDLKLFMRHEIRRITELTGRLFNVLTEQSNLYREYLMPGYTHMQIAMPSSFGLWFGAFAESLTDDMQLMLSAYRIVNQNPLGSAAGYGSSFPVNRQLTTDLLGFEQMHYNAMYAQMTRGKTERVVAWACSSIAATLSRMAGDICLFSSQNFGFVELPEEITTGSSIMPHKKNPDVFELLRAKCNKLQALPMEIERITGNLPSGYFRDYQVIKESFLPAFSVIASCLDIAIRMIPRIKPVQDILDNDLYRYIFSVEEVNRLVLKGVPFREAYKIIAAQIREGTFEPDPKLDHTHEGSIGNLSNEKIAVKMDQILNQFHFEKIDSAIDNLLKQ